MSALLETDPLGLLLTTDGDVDMSAGWQFQAGLDAIIALVRFRLQLIRGEWFLDLDAGVPYLERPGVPASMALLGQKFNEGRMRRAIRDAILGAPGVTSIAKLDITFSAATRAAAITWSARCRFGETEPDVLALGVT